jgi:hypothetical protein
MWTSSVRVAVPCCLSGPQLSRGFLGLLLTAEFYGRATGNLVFGIRQGSVHAYKLTFISCSEQSILPFIVAELAYSWPKSMPTVVLQLKRAQHTHAPVTPQAWAHFIQAHFRSGQAARVQHDPQTSVIARGRATFFNMPCFNMPSLLVVTAAVRRAI